MKIPTTKNGRHELIFDHSSWTTLPFFLRYAVLSRMSYELLAQVDLSPERMKELLQSPPPKKDIYAALRSTDRQWYNITLDSAGLFKDITKPVEGTPVIEGGRIVSIWGHEYYEARSFGAPLKDYNFEYDFFDDDLISNSLCCLEEKIIEKVGFNRHDNDNLLKRINLDTLLTDADWRATMKKVCLACVLRIKKKSEGIIIGRESNKFTWDKTVTLCSEYYGFNKHQTENGTAIVPQCDWKKWPEAVIALCDEYSQEMNERD